MGTKKTQKPKNKHKAFASSPLPFVQKISIEETNIITVQTFTQAV